MNILVTGAGGFLGPHVAAELRRRRPGARLVLLDRAACDLRDAGAARRAVDKAKPSLVFHLAGTTRPLDWTGLWDAHVRATINVLEAVRRVPGARVVIPGSSAEYGAGAGRGPVSEDATTEPLTAYGATKLSQTLAALSYRHHGLAVSVARVFNAIGPGIPERLALGAFARQLAAIERCLQPPELKVGNLTPRRDFVDVRDVARALVDLASAPPGLYNVCSGRSVSIEELLKTLIRLSGLKIVLRADAARRRALDLPRIVGSHRKLTAATGWRPRISLRQSLSDALDWCRRA